MRGKKTKAPPAQRLFARRRRHHWLLLACIAAPMSAGCERPAADTESPSRSSATFDLHNSDKAKSSNSSATSPVELGTDIRLEPASAKLDLEHVYLNGQTGNALLVETIGGGVAWIDFDNDGWMDLYCCQGGDPTQAPTQDSPSDQLFKNESGQRLQSASSGSRIVEIQYSQGVSVADFDNDGFDDIYVTNVGPNTLWWNCGDGTFVEAADNLDVQDSSWSVSTAWADLNLDGLLDLYVCNYCDYNPKAPKECRDQHGVATICNPAELPPIADKCFLNTGQGFVESSQSLGLVGPDNRALGVAIADFSGDGWPDIYVSNDTTANFLFISQNGKQFVESANELGCSVDRTGTPQGSMGIAVWDFDNNQRPDIYVTNYEEESNTLYNNLGPQGFSDATAIAGLHRPTMPLLGFGTVSTDLNSDGQPELFVANGHVNNARNAVDPRMPAQLFCRQSNGRWTDHSSKASQYFLEPMMGRGVAVADFDNDADQDIVVLNQNANCQLLANVSQQGSYVTVELKGTKSNRNAIGSRVTIEADGFTATQEIIGGGSYASASSRQMHFGLGEASGPIQVSIQWPSGKSQVVTAQSNEKIVVVEPYGDNNDL